MDNLQDIHTDNGTPNPAPHIPEEYNQERDYLQEQILIDNKPLFFIEYGKEFGQKTNGQEGALVNAYDKIYKHLLESAGLDNTSISRRIARLQDEKSRRKAEVDGNTTKINDHNTIINECKRKIEDIINTVARIGEDTNTSQGKKIVALVATIGSALFLVTLYYHYAYFVFGGKTVSGSRITEFGDIFQVPILRILWENNAMGSVLMYIGMPLFFIGLAFAIHYFFERKDWLLFGLMVFGTFLIDFGIAYKLSKTIQQDELQSARASGGIDGTNPIAQTESGMNLDELETWTCWTDPNFYIFLSLGFLSFILLGIIYTVYVNISDVATRKENKFKEKEPLEREIIIQQGHITAINATNKDILLDIDAIQRDIAALQSGVIPIDYPKLYSLLGLFMQGWTQFVVYRWDKSEDTQKDKITKGKTELQNWLSIKKGYIKNTQ